MKKLLVATNILFLGIITFQACRVTAEQQIVTDERSPVNVYKNTAGDRAIDIDFTKSPGFSQPFVPELGMIDFALAKKMSLDYKNDSYKGRVSGTTEPDATCIWFSMESLQQYFNNIKASVSSSTDCAPLLGIRMYYIKYPTDVDDYESTRVLDDGANRHHSIMLVPTYYDRDRKLDIDFDMTNVGTNPCKPRPYYLASDTSTMRSILTFTNPQYFISRRDPADGVPLALNHGGISPPPFNADGIFPIPDGPELVPPTKRPQQPSLPTKKLNTN